MKKQIKYTCKCEDCKGTGIYVGFAENKSGIGVICNSCEGKGFQDIEINYETFDKKARRNGITRVIETNPGIGLGSNGDFGGMPYKDWFDGKPFPEKAEMRNYVCPAWWYQCTDYSKKPRWKECIRMGSFSSCPSFKKKDKCWERFDKENKK